ncbi:MAG: hypothetical protein CMJ96_06050 [Planctomycetes bacterium]|nr:hypothetical protein [Planctomycetota bacterium]
MEVVAWWLVLLDATIYNVVAWGGKDWYEAKFGRFARIFPATKAFGLLYWSLVAWLGLALARAEVPIFGI